MGDTNGTVGDIVIGLVTGVGVPTTLQGEKSRTPHSTVVEKPATALPKLTIQELRRRMAAKREEPG